MVGGPKESWIRHYRQRSSGVEFIGCWPKHLGFCASSNEAEGRALLEGMQLAHKNGYRMVVFEIDSLEVYKAVSIGAGGADWSLSWLGAVLVFLRSNPSWKFQFSSRESNSTADGIAHKARSQYWSRLDANPWCIVV
ncbi:hypothetical protein QQ045_001821 [Rhodiola kirilowii]